MRGTAIDQVKKSKGLIGLKQAAQMHGVAIETVRRWIAAGHLPAVLVGNTIIVRRKDAATVRDRVPSAGSPGHKKNRTRGAR